MLPRIWKKLLLAICIIAILFNITSKLVNRISIEKTIARIPEGIEVLDFFKTEESNKTEENVSYYNTVEDSQIIVESQNIIE